MALLQLDELKHRGMLAPERIVRLGAFGLSSDRAKINFWRHETMPLPLTYLGDEDLLESLDAALQAAEDGAWALRSAVRRLAEIVSTSEQAGRPDADRVTQLAESLRPGTRYWARLEQPFRRLLLELPGEEENQEQRLAAWRDEVCGIARSVFDNIVDGLEPSPRILKAVHTSDRGARKTLNSRLRRILEPVLERR